MSFIKQLTGIGFVCAVLAMGFSPGNKAAAADVDPGACIRCEAFGDAETCKRCLDTPDSTKATVPAACKAAANTDCKAQVNGECKVLGNPTQFLSCLKEDKKCADAIKKCAP